MAKDRIHKEFVTMFAEGIGKPESYVRGVLEADFKKRYKKIKKRKINNFFKILGQRIDYVLEN